MSIQEQKQEQIQEQITERTPRYFVKYKESFHARIICILFDCFMAIGILSLILFAHSQKEHEITPGIVAVCLLTFILYPLKLIFKSAVSQGTMSLTIHEPFDAVRIETPRPEKDSDEGT